MVTITGKRRGAAEQPFAFLCVFLYVCVCVCVFLQASVKIVCIMFAPHDQCARIHYLDKKKKSVTRLQLQCVCVSAVPSGAAVGPDSSVNTPSYSPDRLQAMFTMSWHTNMVGLIYNSAIYLQLHLYEFDRSKYN